MQAVWAIGGRKGGGDRVSSITLYNLLVPRGLSTPNGRVNEDRQVIPLFGRPPKRLARIFNTLTILTILAILHSFSGGNSATIFP